MRSFIVFITYFITNLLLARFVGPVSNSWNILFLVVFILVASIDVASTTIFVLVSLKEAAVSGESGEEAEMIGFLRSKGEDNHEEAPANKNRKSKNSYKATA